MFGAGEFRLCSRLPVHNTNVVILLCVPVVPDMLVQTCRTGAEILQVPELCCQKGCTSENVLQIHLQSCGVRVTTGFKDQCVMSPQELLLSSLCPTHRPYTLIGLHRGVF